MGDQQLAYQKGLGFCPEDYENGETIEVNYRSNGKWFQGKFRGEDPKRRPGYVGVEYTDTPKKILGALFSEIRKVPPPPAAATAASSSAPNEFTKEPAFRRLMSLIQDYPVTKDPVETNRISGG